METQNFDNYSATIDCPDSRDYTSEEFFGAAEAYNFPEKFSLEKIVNEKQGYIGACSVFGTLNAYNEKFANASEKSYSNMFDFWKAWELCKTRGASDTAGFSIQGAMQACKDLGFIGAYILVYAAGSANVAGMKAAIYGRKSGLTTGSATINWNETLRTEELVTSGVPYGRGAHCFDITEWDDNFVNLDGSSGCFTSYNSFSLPAGGKFRIPYNQIHKLFSVYEFALTSEQEKIANVKKFRLTENLEKARKAKVWDESRPNDKVTPLEKFKMCMRAIGLPDDHKLCRKFAHILINDKIVREKFLTLYNEKNPYDIITVEDFSRIFDRGVKRNPKIEDAELTRVETAEIIGRDFL